MTTEEFKEWLGYHTTRFPALKKWLDAQEDSKAVVVLWQKTLSGVSLEHATVVTDRLYTGEVPIPKNCEYEKELIIPLILQLARTIASYEHRKEASEATRRSVREPRYTCKTCLDQGIVMVWSPRSMEAMRSGQFDLIRETRGSCFAACSCEKGLKRQNPDHPKAIPLRAYDSQVMLIVAGGHIGNKESIEELRDWIASGKIEDPDFGEI